jgi:general secretion pathway protein H
MISAADPQRRRGGFTLIEMVVVLAILAISVGLLVPLFGPRGSGAELNAAAVRVRSAIAEARTTAIAQGRPVSFRGDVAGGFWLDNRHRRLDSGEGRRLRVLIAGAAAISFFPSGSSSGGHIVVQGPYSRRELSVDAVTGRAALLP